MPEKVIEFKNIAKKYCFSSAKQSLINSFLSFFRSAQTREEVWALKDIDFSVEKGQILGIIGENASGKTTILRIISRITRPSYGKMIVKGKVAGLLDLGAGFHPELTGRENIYLDAALYGLSRKETDAVFTDIIEFSGLEHSIDSQVKTYSQGMLVRLGFSVAVHVNPDIFLIDDSLAVGDEEFQRKCLARIIQMNKQGKTIVIVSHDLDSLSRIAARGILLKDGQMIKDDSIHKSIVRYVQAVGEKQSIACLDKDKLSIIFNSGRIALLWDGKPITCDSGGYLSVKVLDKWLMSWQAHWQVIKTEKDFFRVEGKWPNSQLKAVIEIKLQSDKRFECKSEVNIGDQVKADKAIFGFMFNDKYKQYLHADKIQEIAGVENSADEQWLDLYRTDQSNALLVLSASEPAPAVWADFCIEEQNGFGLIQAKNKSFEASVIQAQVLLNQQSTVKFNASIQLLDKTELKQKITDQQEQRTLSNGNLMLKLQQKYFDFSVGQRVITKASGLRFGFQYQNHFYNIFDGKWDIEKNSAARLMINSDFPAKGISARLDLSLKENELLINIELKNKQNKDLDRQFIHIEADFIEDYASYFCLNQEDDFLAATEFDEKIILKDAQCGFIGLNMKNKRTEGLILTSKDNAQIDLYNCRQEIKSRRVHFISSALNPVNVSLMLITHDSQKQDFLLSQRKKFKVHDLLTGSGLTIDSSQDRLQVFLGEKEITALDGFSSGIFLNKRWYESHAVAKKIEKKGNILLITLQRKVPDIIEYWEIELKHQGFEWKVYLESSEQVEKLEYKAGIMLNPEFGQWINAYEKGRFSKDVNGIEFTDLKEGNSVLLGAAADDSDCCVLFELKDKLGQVFAPLLQYSNWARILQFSTEFNPRVFGAKKKLVFSSRFKAVDKVTWQKEIEKYCDERFAVIPTDTVKLLAMQHKAELYYQNKPISADCGLAVSISAYDEFDSFRGHWEIEKPEQNALNIRITYKQAQFAQNWYLKAEGGYIFWKVELEVFEPTEISGLVINLFLPLSFVSWLSEQSRGAIALKNHGQGFESINMLDNRTKYIVFKQDNSDIDSAAIALAPMVDMQQWLVHMYKPENKDTIALGIKRLFADAKLLLDPGVHGIFKANLEIFSQAKPLDSFNQAIIRHTDKQVNTISNNKLKIVLEKAKINLFFADEQLTAGLGLYTGIKSDDQWSDSSQELWKIDQRADEINTDLCSSRVVQTHKLKLISENQLLWNVCFELKEENIQQVIVGIMLDNKFTDWRITGDNARSGKFPEKNKDDDWQNIAVSKNPIAVSGKNSRLPEISWEAVCSVDCVNIIEDADKNHNSRVLVSKTKDIPGQTKLIEFKIRLKINDQ